MNVHGTTEKNHDPKAGVAYLERASKQGNGEASAKASNILGTVYKTGYPGVDQDKKKALEYF